jgi:hypothetical protein
VNPLLAYDVLAAIGVLICVAILHDRPTRPTPRIAIRPPTTDVTPLERPAWLDQPDDTETWTYRARNPRRSRGPLPYNEIGRAVFPDPPAPKVFRQARTGPDGRIPVLSTVAASLGPA